MIRSQLIVQFQRLRCVYVTNQFHPFMIKTTSSLLVFFGLLITLFSCNETPDYLASGASFRVSSDSISFDTIVSSYGTTTKSFRIINESIQALLIDKIELADGSDSYFRLNVDGKPASSASAVEIPGRDSIFVFIEATFPDFDTDSICFHCDSVLVSSSDKTKGVRLYTWSQDVIKKTGILKSGEVWEGNRPYLIRDSIEIPYGDKLIIKEGVQVLLHKYAFIKVVGDLIVEGTEDEPVVFQGDRFDTNEDGVNYEDAPGQWGGISVYPFSKGTKLNYAVINGADFGIWAGGIGYPELAELEISNSIIKNNSNAGIISFGAKINCWNTFFADSYACLVLYNQGEYHFNHITINNHYSEAHKVGSVHISDYFDYDKTRYVGEFTEISFSNSIIAGSNDNEFTMNKLKPEAIPVSFDHVSLKQKSGAYFTDYVKKNDLFLNKDSLFNDYETGNFMYPDTLAFAIDRGDMTIASQYPNDLLGNSRTADGQPDLGVVEFQK